MCWPCCRVADAVAEAARLARLHPFQRAAPTPSAVLAACTREARAVAPVPAELWPFHAELARVAATANQGVALSLHVAMTWDVR